MNRLQLLDTDLLKKYSDPSSIAIVGNSGISKEDQSVIDSCDIIVRFNNYATRKNINHTANPYQCDILFSTFDTHSQDANPKDVVIGIPFPFKAKEIYSKPMKWYPRSRHWMVDPYKNMRMCKDLGIDSLGSSHPLPSLGFTAFWHLKDWPIKIHVCGFSWFCDIDTKIIQGLSIHSKENKKNWNHNYRQEAIWIIRNLIKKDNFIFSADCLNILNFIQLELQIK